jgi:hypothetical protein
LGETFPGHLIGICRPSGLNNLSGKFCFFEENRLEGKSRLEYPPGMNEDRSRPLPVKQQATL